MASGSDSGLWHLSSRLLVAALAVMACSCGACGGGAGQDPPPLNPDTPVFNATRAFADLETQCDFGPRRPGSEGHQAQLEWMRQTLGELAPQVVEQAFTCETYFGGPFDCVNLIAVFSAETGGPATLLGAHWDTRPVADEDPDPANRQLPVPGANDGASGVAILMELARLFAEQPPPRPVYLGFFDCEDSGKSGSGLRYSGFCLGSTHMARNWPEELPRPARMILVDLVGGMAKPNPRLRAWPGRPADSLLHLPIEGHSWSHAPELVNEIWTLAERLGHRAFRRELGRWVVDDHVPFIDFMGIPAVNLVDFAPPTWHTVDDTPEYCSPAALRQVGETLAHLLYHP